MLKIYNMLSNFFILCTFFLSSLKVRKLYTTFELVVAIYTFLYFFVYNVMVYDDDDNNIHGDRK